MESLKEFMMSTAVSPTLLLCHDFANISMLEQVSFCLLCLALSRPRWAQLPLRNLHSPQAGASLLPSPLDPLLKCA